MEPSTYRDGVSGRVGLSEPYGWVLYILQGSLGGRLKDSGPVLGADTETTAGYVRVLALKDGRRVECGDAGSPTARVRVRLSDSLIVEETHKDYKDDSLCAWRELPYVGTDACLDLLYAAAQNARWVNFWNLGFDFTAIFKPWVMEHADTLRATHYKNIQRNQRLKELGLKAEEGGDELTAEELREIQKLRADLDGDETIERFDTERFHVVLIGSKGFSLCPRTEGGGRKFKKGREWFFDTSPWYSSSFGGISLEFAARKYLHEGKTNVELGISRESIGNVYGYYEAHREDIFRYCVRDCDLTARLMELTVQGFERLGYPFPDHPFSRASVSREYLKTTGRLEPTAKRYSEHLGHSSFSNLWVKSFRGGVFLQIGAGRWSDPYALDINSAYPDAMVAFPSLRDAFPVPRDDPRFAACYFRFYRITLAPTPRTPTRDRGETRKIYGWSTEEVSVCVTQLDMDVLDSMGESYVITDAVGIVTPHPEEHPLAYLKEVYDRKSSVKKQYGKDSVEYANLKILLNGTYGILAQRKPRETPYTNLIYASYVTAWCRKKLWAAVRETEERGDYVVALATDGLLVSGEGARALWRERDSTALGAWSYTAHSEAVCYESGVGFLDRCGKCEAPVEQGGGPDHAGDHEDVVKRRGMPKLTRKALMTCEEITWTETSSRPLKLRSALIQKRTHLLGVFEKHDRTLCPVCSYRDAGMSFPRELVKAPLKSFFTRSWRLRLRGQVGDRLTPPVDPARAAEWWAVLRRGKHEKGYLYPPRATVSPKGGRYIPSRDSPSTVKAHLSKNRTTPERTSERGEILETVPLGPRGASGRKASRPRASAVVETPE